MWRIAILLSLLCTGFVCSDDAFGKYYTNAGEVFSMIAVPGGYVVACHHSPIGGRGEILVMKILLRGTIAWKRAFRSEFALQGTHMIQTSDGGFAITGIRYSSPIGPTDILLMKLNRDGKLMWVKKYFTFLWDSGDQIIQTQNGGFLLFSINGFDLILLRVDAVGNLLWTHSWEAGFPEMLGVKRLQNGHVLAAITTMSGMAVLEFTPDGEISKKVGIDGTAQFMHAVFLADGGFAVTGFFYPDQKQQMFVARFNQEGKLVWEKAFTFDRGLEPSDITQNAKGELVIAGNLNSHDYRVFVIRLGPMGKVLNVHSFGIDLIQSAGIILPVNQDQLLFSGHADFTTFGADWACIFKLNSENVEGCSTFTNESFNIIPAPPLQMVIPETYVKTPPEYEVTSPGIETYTPAITGHSLCY